MKQLFSLAASSIRALLLGLALGMSLTAATTTITDTLQLPNGNPAAGVDFTITQTAFFSGSTYFPAWALQPHPVTDSSGSFSFALQPNPAGQLYTVTLTQPNGVKTSTCWNVPVSGSPVNVLAVLSTTCGTPPLSTLNVGQIANFGSAVGMGPYTAYMPNPTYPPAYVINSASTGDVDLYTVPANRRALLLGWVVSNPGSSANIYLETKISASYYRLTNTASNQAWGVDEAIVTNSPPRVLNAGETASINTDTAGLSVWLHLVEFDATSPLRSVTLTSFSAGDNTLYTVPAGKSFEVLPFFGGIDLTVNGRSRLFYSNGTAGTRTLTVYAVPKGSVASANNAINIGTLVQSTKVNVDTAIYGSLAPGDFIDVNLGSAAAGQMAWMNIIEH